jgi:hypothetical protein
MSVRTSVAVLTLLVACDSVPTVHGPEPDPLIPSVLRQLDSAGVVFVLGAGGAQNALNTAPPFRLWDLQCASGRFTFAVMYDSLFFYNDPAFRTAVTHGRFRRARLVHRASGVHDELVREGGAGSFTIDRNTIVAHYQLESSGNYFNPEFRIRPDSLIATEPWGAACGGTPREDFLVGTAEWRWIRR